MTIEISVFNETRRIVNHSPGSRLLLKGPDDFCQDLIEQKEIKCIFKQHEL